MDICAISEDHGCEKKLKEVRVAVVMNDRIGVMKSIGVRGSCHRGLESVGVREVALVVSVDQSGIINLGLFLLLDLDIRVGSQVGIGKQGILVTIGSSGGVSVGMELLLLKNTRGILRNNSSIQVRDEA